MGMIQEFKEFAMKGNLVDMAVGIIIGVAFGKVVTSVVNDVIMPPIGMAMGQVDFKDLQIVLKEASVVNGVGVAPVAIKYGMFANTLIDFLIVALVLFMVVKGMNKMIRKEEAKAA